MKYEDVISKQIDIGNHLKHTKDYINSYDMMKSIFKYHSNRFVNRKQYFEFQDYTVTNYEEMSESELIDHLAADLHYTSDRMSPERLWRLQKQFILLIERDKEKQNNKR